MTATNVPLVHDEALLIGRKGNVGEVRLVSGGCWPIDTTYYISVPEQLDARYLMHYLRHLDLKRLDSSTATPSLRRQDLEAQALRFPALPEQRRIVDILEDHLSHLEKGDRELKSAADRTTALLRASLDRLFGQDLSTTLGELVSDISAGKSFGSANAPASDGEWGIIKVSAMTWGAFDATQNKAVPATRVDPRFEIISGDLLVSRANTSEYVGASVLVGQVRRRLLLSDKSLRIAPKPGVSSEWLWRVLQAPSSRQQISSLATGTKDSMRNISQASLREIRVPSADIEAQRVAILEFAGVETAHRQLLKSISAQTSRSAALRRGVLAAAFEGKLTGRRTDTEVIEELAEA